MAARCFSAWDAAWIRLSARSSPTVSAPIRLWGLSSSAVSSKSVIISSGIATDSSLVLSPVTSWIPIPTAMSNACSPPPPTTETPSYNTLVFAHLIGSGIKGNVDMFYAGAFVNYEAQVKVCHQLVEMLRPLKSTKTSTHAEDMGRASGHYRCTGSTQVSAGADKNQLIFGGQVGFLERGKHYMHSGLDRHHPQRTDQHTGWQVEV